MAITVKEFKEYMRYSVKNLMKRKLRAWLTILGIFIGIAAIVALISLGQGLQNAINEQFQQLGTDKIIIQPGGALFGAVGVSPESTKITSEEVDLVKRINGVELVSYSGIRMGKLEFEDQQIFTYVWGPVLDKSAVMFEQIGHLTAETGREIRSSDKYKLMLGYRFGHTIELFDKKVRPGDKIRLEGKDFDVVGIAKRIGNNQDDSMILIPIDTFEEIYKSKDKYDYLMIQTASGADVKKVAEDIEKALRKKRDEDEGKETFSVQTSAELIESFNTILSIVQGVLIAIAAISLMVGGVGIMNTMYTSVLERTKEIGIMKAIGAKNSQILMLFLIESGLIGFVGGMIGVILGALLSIVAVAGVSQALGTNLIQTGFSPELFIGALVFSFLVGCLSGILPALQASKLKPVDALRK